MSRELNIHLFIPTFPHLRMRKKVPPPRWGGVRLDTYSRISNTEQREAVDWTQDCDNMSLVFRVVRR